VKNRPGCPSDENRRSVRFYFPRSWNLIWAGENFNGTHRDQISETIASKVFEKENTLVQYFKEMFPDHRIMHTGQNLSEILGNYYWKEGYIFLEPLNLAPTPSCKRATSSEIALSYIIEKVI